MSKSNILTYAISFIKISDDPGRKRRWSNQEKKGED